MSGSLTGVVALLGAGENVGVSDGAAAPSLYNPKRVEPYPVYCKPVVAPKMTRAQADRGRCGVLLLWRGSAAVAMVVAMERSDFLLVLEGQRSGRQRRIRSPGRRTCRIMSRAFLVRIRHHSMATAASLRMVLAVVVAVMSWGGTGAGNHRRCHDGLRLNGVIPMAKTVSRRVPVDWRLIRTEGCRTTCTLPVVVRKARG